MSFSMRNKSLAVAALVLGLVTTAVRADEPNAKAAETIVSDANASDAKLADAKKAADLKWAKGIAADFFAAAVSGQEQQAAALVDASLIAAFGKNNEAQFRDWLNNTFATYGYGEAVFESEEIAPDRDEVVLKGHFKDTKPALAFSIRVVKNKDSGMWRVSYCRVGGR
jgi:methionine-rich copper-binding protein CopC